MGTRVVRKAAIAAVALAAAGLAAGPAASEEQRDPYFGEALFYAYQGHFFDALERLDAEMAQHYGIDEPELDPLFAQIGEAEFSVGDFELHYRMHQRAGRAVKAVLEADVPPLVRNDAAYRLARIHFQKGQPRDALIALERIEGPVPDAIRDDIDFLRANVYLALGRSKDAVEVLRPLRGSDELEGFSGYNLGIALLRDGRTPEAIRELERAGRVRGGDPERSAIRDKSNLLLGTLLFEAAEFDLSQRSLDRVRLAGPFSNQALLRAGWADVYAERFERALVPWGILSKRAPTDAAVQEAMLALPYAYSRLDIHGRAAVLYEKAVNSFGHELEKIDASIRSIRSGAFLEALAREEIRQDEDWVIHLRRLPDAPETFYLMSLMASHDFQAALQNHLDLEDLGKRLRTWKTSLDAFEDLIAHRRRYYEPLLPGIDRQFRKLDAQTKLRLEQRKQIRERLDHMLIAPRPDLLVTSAEHAAASRLEEMEASLGDGDDPQRQALRARIARLRGTLLWTRENLYHERLTEAHRKLREVDRDVDALKERYDAFVRTRQAATHSYEGYGPTIDRLRARVGSAQENVEILQARQGHVLETIAIAELEKRRDRLEGYQHQARFAFADSYDRAAKAQAAVR
jgi:tetratricopeptide (TPR) repeat protein